MGTSFQQAINGKNHLFNTQNQFHRHNSSHFHPQMQAMMVTPNLNLDNCWYLDSSSTNHVTNSFDNCPSGNEYSSGSQIHVGNATFLDILHTGQTFLTLSHSSLSHTFQVQNLLHVPHMIKNLLSVSKFSQDNNVFFEFIIPLVL